MFKQVWVGAVRNEWCFLGVGSAVLCMTAGAGSCPGHGNKIGAQGSVTLLWCAEPWIFYAPLAAQCVCRFVACCVSRSFSISGQVHISYLPSEVFQFKREFKLFHGSCLDSDHRHDCLESQIFYFLGEVSWTPCSQAFAGSAILSWQVRSTPVQEDRGKSVEERAVWPAFPSNEDFWYKDIISIPNTGTSMSLSYSYVNSFACLLSLIRPVGLRGGQGCCLRDLHRLQEWDKWELQEGQQRLRVEISRNSTFPSELSIATKALPFIFV